LGWRVTGIGVEDGVEEGTIISTGTFFKPFGVGMSDTLCYEVSHTRKRGLVLGEFGFGGMRFGIGVRGRKPMKILSEGRSTTHQKDARGLTRLTHYRSEGGNPDKN